MYTSKTAPLYSSEMVFVSNLLADKQAKMIMSSGNMTKIFHIQLLWKPQQGILYNIDAHCFF